MEFVDVDYTNARKLLSKSSFLSQHTYFGDLEKYGCNSEVLLIPKRKMLEFRVKVVTVTEMNVLATKYSIVEHGGHKYVFGTEFHKLDKTLGNLLSCWKKTDGSRSFPMTYKFAVACWESYGPGYGSRKKSSCYGVNSYRDQRHSKRPHPTPFVAESDIPFHQYYNERQDNFVLQSIIEKSVRWMANQALTQSLKMNKPLMDILQEFSSKIIITCGHPPSSSKNSPIGLCNSCHNDSGDMFKKETLEKLYERNQSNKFIEKTLLMTGFGKCGYRFLTNESHHHSVPSVVIKQFFSYNGLGIGFEIEDGHVHNFYASSLSHQTTAAIGFSNSHGFLCSNYRDHELIFAWGSTSSKSTG